MAHPDFSLPFILDTDASDHAIGAVVSQRIGKVEKVVAYASRSLSKSERKYCVTRKELLALVYFVKYFRHYLYGQRFTIRTDHGSLRWLMKFKNPEGQVARWLATLAAYQMTVEHRPGRLHGNADGLSRRPCRQCGCSESGDEDTPVSHDTMDIEFVTSIKQFVDSADIKQLQQGDEDIHRLVKRKQETNVQRD